jgi:hypothetical protein
MLDSSGSMTDLVGGTTTTKWDAITQALSTFFTDPNSAGVGVGLQHFPVNAVGVPESCTDSSQCPGLSGPCMTMTCSDHTGACNTDTDCLEGGQCVPAGQCGNYTCIQFGSPCEANGITCTALTSAPCYNADSCSDSDYATPLVEIAALNGASSALNAAIATISPIGATPTAPALGGAIEHAKAWAAANPTHTVVVLLATDGMPTECKVEDIPRIAQLAASAVASSPSIKTFAIGVFATTDIQSGAPTDLDQIASGGGTQSAFIIDTSQNNVEQAFLSALTSIRATKLACTYQLPTPSDAGALDFGQVNVDFTASTTSAAMTIPYTATLAACNKTTGGWYYDVEPSTAVTPTKVLMCPATCTMFGKNEGGEVDIRVGCQTVGVPVK